MKKYYLYRQPVWGSYDERVGEWTFEDKFDSYDGAWNQAKENATKSSWKIWKIEEVLVFE